MGAGEHRWILDQVLRKAGPFHLLPVTVSSGVREGTQALDGDAARQPRRPTRTLVTSSPSVYRIHDTHITALWLLPDNHPKSRFGQVAP